MHKAPGGLIRVEFAVENGKYKDVNISGDFFCFPKDSVDRLATVIEDCPANNVSSTIKDFYQTYKIDIPGITPDDWIQVFRI